MGCPTLQPQTGRKTKPGFVFLFSFPRGCLRRRQRWEISHHGEGWFSWETDSFRGELSGLSRGQDLRGCGMKPARITARQFLRLLDRHRCRLPIPLAHHRRKPDNAPPTPNLSEARLFKLFTDVLFHMLSVLSVVLLFHCLCSNLLMRAACSDFLIILYVVLQP